MQQNLPETKYVEINFIRDIKVVREFSPKYFLTDQVERNFLGKEKNEKFDINQ